jgi:hypothetical protein
VTCPALPRMAVPSSSRTTACDASVDRGLAPHTPAFGVVHVAAMTCSGVRRNSDSADDAIANGRPTGTVANAGDGRAYVPGRTFWAADSPPPATRAGAV